MKPEYASTLVKLKVEQHRLINWAKLVRLDYRDDQLVLNRMSKSLVMGILEEQQKLLYTFGRLNKNYQKLPSPLLEERPEPFRPQPGHMLLDDDDDAAGAGAAALRFPQTEELVQKALTFSSRFTSVPKRLRWAALDKGKMDKLVADLAHFNDKMHEALDKAQMENLLELQTRTNYQIVLLNHSVANLGKIVESQLSTSRLPGKDEYSDDDEYEDRYGYEYGHGRDCPPLAALAQFKAVNRQIEDSAALDDVFAEDVHLDKDHASQLRETRITLAKLNPSTFPEETDQVHRRSEVLYAGTPAWIEWKDDASHPSLSPKTAERVSQLAALLKQLHRTVEFRAPRCLGYMRDEANLRFGLVFAKPHGIPASQEPQSLRALFDVRDGAAGRIVPPLTRRVALMRRLAETLERLHAVGWLHKGLSSANVLFFSASSTQDADLVRPYICGFDYSRPAVRNDLTEQPSDDKEADLYRHPAVQSDAARRGYKKSHDVYALGVVLLEIAHWAPVETILGIDVNTSGARVMRGVRGRLLAESAPLAFVRTWCGTAVEAVVRACLGGIEGLGLREGEDEGDEGVAARLQMAFYEKVVRRLKEVRGL
jgi:hypothetical protein